MQVEVIEDGGEYVVHLDGEPVATPYGSVLATRHAELAAAVAEDVRTVGPDPTGGPSLVQLHASYLDFGRRVPRPMLEENIRIIEPTDLFLQRPADPELMMPLMVLWGPPDLRGRAFAEALAGLTLRQLMTVMVAGAALHSAILGIKIVTTDRDLTPLALGACGEYFETLMVRLPHGTLRFGGGERYVPPQADWDFCARCCKPRRRLPAGFESRCAMRRYLGRMRFYASFPDED